MTDEPPSTVDIHYIKSNDFREIACDGALGGPTPRGKIWLAFYTERLPLPKIVRHGLVANERGDLSVATDQPGTVVDGRAGIIRNVEFGLYLSEETANELHKWLEKQLTTLKDRSQ